MSEIELQSNQLAVFAGKQSAKGVAPTSWIKLKVASQDLGVDPETLSERYGDGSKSGNLFEYRGNVFGEGGLEVAADYWTTAALRAWTFGNSVINSGSGLPTSITEESDSTNANWTTFVVLFGDPLTGAFEGWRFADSKINTYTSESSVDDNVKKISLNILSVTPTWTTVAPTSSVTDTKNYEPYLHTDLCGSVIISEINGGSSVGEISQLTEEINNNLELVYGDCRKPHTMHHGLREVNLSGTMIATETAYELIKKSLFGTASPEEGATVGKKLLHAYMSATYDGSVNSQGSPSQHKAIMTWPKVRLGVDSKPDFQDDGGTTEVGWVGVAKKGNGTGLVSSSVEVETGTPF